MIRHWDRINDPAAYLSRTVLHACGRASRKARRQLENQRPLTSLDLATMGSSDHPRELLDALGRLPRNQRMVVVLRYYDGLGEREIAALTGLRPGSIGPTLTRALRVMRQELDATGNVR